MDHAVLFNHWADGCDAGLMAIVGVGDRRDGDDGTFLESLQFVFKYVEATKIVLFSEIIASFA